MLKYVGTYQFYARPKIYTLSLTLETYKLNIGVMDLMWKSIVHRVFRHISRSNMHNSKRSYTKRYRGLYASALRSYISVLHTEKYDPLRKRKWLYMIHVYGFRIRSPFCSVFLHLRSFFVVIRPQRLTIVALIHVIRQSTILKEWYTAVCHHI